jgi:two-component system copper resistance phosphate regulon response regulator CusR
MKVLVIENAKKTAEYLRKGLAEQGYVVDACQTGQEGISFASQFKYDLLILDPIFPECDGWSVLSALRSNSAVPILLVSPLNSVSEKVRGLQLGADDYIVRPFAFSELLARVKSILRRRPSLHAEVIRVGDLELDLLRHKAARAGQRLQLTLKEFQLLALLASHPSGVFSRTLITEHIWDMNFDSNTNLVDVHIRRLRSKVDDPFDKKLIHTVRGLGYVLEER